MVNKADKLRHSVSVKRANKKKEPDIEQWDLLKHGISPSGLRQWLRCREQFRLSYCENWASKTTNAYLDFGNMVHAVLERATSHNVASLPLNEIRSVIEQTANEIQAEYLFLGAERKQEFELTKGQAEVVMDHYFRRWRQADESVDYYASEKRFSIPFKVNDMLSIPLNGTWDRIFQNKGGKGFWIRDTKTKSQINEGNITDMFAHDLQFNFYMLAFLLSEGEAPQGIELDIVRKPSCKPTQKQGSLGAYLSDLHGKIAKDPDHYFLRPKAQFTKAEILSWGEEQLRPMLKDLHQWWRLRMDHYFNPDALIMNHQRSEFFDAIVNGDFSGLKKGAHWQRYIKE